MNVLIAEDEFATAQAIQELVENMGHAAAQAGTGREVLLRLEEHSYGLLILSTQLRDADIKKLLPATHINHPDLPVVALTSHNSLSLEQQVRQLGVICYLIKPLNIEELGSIVAHLSSKQA